MNEWSKKVYNLIRLPFIHFCVNREITANQLTVLNHFITLVFGCYFFSRGTYSGYLLALGVCLINGFLDYLDGDVARQRNGNKELGQWLDSGFDFGVHRLQN